MEPLKPAPNSKCGLAIKSLDCQIINGLRYIPTSSSNGWYIWKGEYKADEDFFDPICIEHLNTYIKIDISEFLDLPPGFRFLIDENKYIDVWYDENLLYQ